MTDEKDIKVYSDIPTGTALATTSSPEQAQALARRIAGEIPPNQCEFHCISCGQSRTLEFDPDEMAALDNNVRSYADTGKCWNCGFQTLRPKDEFIDGSESITAMAKKAKRAEFKEQADVLVDRVKEEIATFVGVPGPAPSQTPTDPAPDAPPGAHAENLPDAADVTLDDLKR